MCTHEGVIPSTITNFAGRSPKHSTGGRKADRSYLTYGVSVTK